MYMNKDAVAFRNENYKRSSHNMVGGFCNTWYPFFISNLKKTRLPIIYLAIAHSFGNFVNGMGVYNCHAVCSISKWLGNSTEIEGILPKGPYLSLVSMAGRALLAGYQSLTEAWYLVEHELRGNILYCNGRLSLLSLIGMWSICVMCRTACIDNLGLK